MLIRKGTVSSWIRLIFVPVNGLRNRGSFNSMWQMWSWLFLLNDLVPKSSCYFLYWSSQPPHIPHVSHGDAGVCFFFSTYEHQVRICIAPLFKNARRERSGSRRIVSGMPGAPWDDWYMIMMDTERWESRKFKNMMQYWLLHNFFFENDWYSWPILLVLFVGYYSVFVSMAHGCNMIRKKAHI